jgi:hypothetical protein
MKTSEKVGPFVSCTKQMTKDWAVERQGRLTYSVFKRIIGGENIEIIDRILKIDPEILKSRGISREPEARRVLSNLLCSQIDERGITIAEDQRLAASVDGFIPDLNAIVEIKQPEKFRTHIPYGDLEQMIWNMWVTQTRVCYYFVYMNEKQHFLAKVHFNKKIWNKMYQQALVILSKRHDIPLPPLPGNGRYIQTGFQLSDNTPCDIQKRRSSATSCDEISV